MSELTPGLHCKACDAPLDQDNDPELCKICMAVVFQYNKQYYNTDVDEDMDNWDLTELIDIDNMTEEI